MPTARNPILPGFHPDPSICRVGDDYYLVTSTFEYFPGLPIHHSRDLVNWRPIGHVLDRAGQLPLAGVRSSGGLYAPAIRHADGVFYVTCTLVGGASESGNFVVTATDPVGPWSDPVWLPDARGIDPSLFFDDDGRAWFLGMRGLPGGAPGRTEIWAREFDREKLALVGPEYVLFYGALVDALWAEGPRLYKHNGLYYLVLAEGGTEHNHAVTVARSPYVTGPYENNPRNPVLTHRHLGRLYPVASVGHADLVRAETGEWYAVALATRPRGGYFANLGRETFLAAVAWEDGWPVVNPGVGRLTDEVAVALPEHPWPGSGEFARDDFDGPGLGTEWNTLRAPFETFGSLTERSGYLRLRVRPETVTEPCTPSFVGRRQQHHDFTAEFELEFAPEGEHEAAGLLLRQSEDFQIRLGVTRRDGGRVAELVVRAGGADTVVTRAPLPSDGPVRLGVDAAGQDYTLKCAPAGAPWTSLPTVDGRPLSTEVAGGFVGTYIGVYATSNGHPSTNTADIEWFGYQPR